MLKLLDISGCVITIDAMGCQKAIAKQIVDKKADYVLSLKGNQSTLHEDVKLFFDDARAHDFYQKNEYQKNEERRIAHGYYETVKKDHGRIETRRYWMVSVAALDWLSQKSKWAGLGSLGAVECERRMGEKISVETRYFLSSLRGSVKKFAHAVRAHWGIENRLHWTLDIAFGEAACPIFVDHAPENLATLRKTALNLLRQDTTSKRGLRAKSKRAGWD